MISHEMCIAMMLTCWVICMYTCSSSCYWDWNTLRHSLSVWLTDFRILTESNLTCMIMFNEIKTSKWAKIIDYHYHYHWLSSTKLQMNSLKALYDMQIHVDFCWYVLINTAHILWHFDMCCVFHIIYSIIFVLLAIKQ